MIGVFIKFVPAFCFCRSLTFICSLLHNILSNSSDSAAVWVFIQDSYEQGSEY
jgi:hypothetical protein